MSKIRNQTDRLRVDYYGRIPVRLISDSRFHYLFIEQKVLEVLEILA